jgi:hypothetical protein
MILTRISADMLFSSNALVDSRISPKTWDIHERDEGYPRTEAFQSTENRDQIAKVRHHSTWSSSSFNLRSTSPSCRKRVQRFLRFHHSTFPHLLIASTTSPPPLSIRHISTVLLSVPQTLLISPYQPTPAAQQPIIGFLIPLPRFHLFNINLLLPLPKIILLTLPGQITNHPDADPPYTPQTPLCSVPRRMLAQQARTSASRYDR